MPPSLTGMLVLGALAIGQPLPADPVPIVRDANGDWLIDPSASFPDSGYHLDIRRFARIPDSADDVRPRVNAVALAPGDDRLFVVDEGVSGNNELATGKIYAVSADGATVAEILNVGEVLPLQRRNGQFRAQGGLRGLAFHPQFDQLESDGYGKFYTTQVVVGTTEPAGVPYLGPSGLQVLGEGSLTEWTATFDEQGRFDGVDSQSVREVFRISIINQQHPIKQPLFNPFAQPDDADYGKLYVSVGDGGDPRAGRDGSSPLGKVLRIDPLQTAGDPSLAPDDNPFVDDPTVLNEVYTLGHRNPHSISFAQDDYGAAHLFVGEVGYRRVEEINLISRGGGDYGWDGRQGTFRTGPGADVVDLLDGPNDPDDGFIYPVAQLGHDGTRAQAIAGGYAISNGSELDGQYFFGDFPTTGEIYSFALDDAFAATVSGVPANLDPVEVFQPTVLFDDDDDPATASVPTTLRDIIVNESDYSGGSRVDIRFGQGLGGELYILNKRNGWIYLVANSTANLPALHGDFDDSGRVDGDDLSAWQRGHSPNAYSAPDLWRWERGYGSAVASFENVARAPEPATSVGMFIGTAGALLRRGRRAFPANSVHARASRSLAG